MASGPETSFTFGEFRLDLRERTLWRDGEIIPLQAKVVDVLAVLVAASGSVVSKSDLMDAVWPDSFVEESNLTQSIYSLRRTLGKDADGRPLIETISKRGYRIAVPIIENAPVRAAAPAAAQPAERDRISARPLMVLTACAVITLIVGGSFFGWKYLARPAAPVENVTFKKLTFSGDVAFPILAADGKTFAYTKDDSIFLQDVATGSSIKLDIPGQKTFGNLQFSTEGESIYFRTTDSFDAGSDLYQVSRFGGSAKKVAEQVWSTVGFTPSGDRMAFVRFYPKQGEWALIIHQLGSHDERKIVTRNLPYTIYRSGFPAWSPDGRRIAIVEQTPEQNNISHLLLVDAETGAESPLATPRFLQIEQVGWLSENKGLVLTARENGQFFQLWRLDLPGGEVRRITNDLNTYRTISVSANGQYMLARLASSYSHIWTANADTPAELRQITFGNSNRDGTSGVTWSPDGNIIYTSHIVGDQDLWSVRPEDGVRKQLTENAGSNNEDPFVTQDGRYIFFESTRTGKRRIWRSAIDGSEPVQITADDTGIDFLPVVSPASVLYYIQRNPRSNVLWQQSLVDGKREMLTEQGKLAPGGFLTISPDGRYLAFKSQKEATGAGTIDIVVMDLSGRAEPLVLPIQTQNAIVVWSQDGKSFDYVDDQDDLAVIWRQDVAGRHPRRQILALEKARISAFAWSSDGRRLALSRGRQESDVVLLSGF